MTVLPASGYLSSNERTQQQMKDALEDQRDFIAEGVGGAAVSALTIASGTITPTGARHTVDTESAASTDDLANIAVDNLSDGRWLVLEAADASRLVVVKHLAGGSGEVETIAGHDILLQHRSRLILERSGTQWRQVMETQLPGGATGTYSDFAGDQDEIPPRAILCYGQTIDAAENPDLAARCPGLVDGSDIIVPDRRERVIVGKNSDSSPSSRVDSSYLDTGDVGNTGGSDDVTLSAAQTPVVEHLHAGGDLLAAIHLHFVSGGLSIGNNTHNHATPSLESAGASTGGSARVTGQHPTNKGGRVTGNATHGHTGSFSANSASSAPLAVTGNSAAASAAATAAVGLLQPSIVATPILWA